jgi:hypothetical protein
MRPIEISVLDMSHTYIHMKKFQSWSIQNTDNKFDNDVDDKSLCGLVVRVLGYRSGGPGSIPGTTKKKSSGSGTVSTQPRECN